MFAFMCINPLLKRVYSKRRKLFPIRVNPCAKGRQNNFNRVVSPESGFIPLKQMSFSNEYNIQNISIGLHPHDHVHSYSRTRSTLLYGVNFEDSVNEQRRPDQNTRMHVLNKVSFHEIILDLERSSMNCSWLTRRCFDKKKKFFSLRKHAYSNILKFLQPKKEKFQIKNSDIFHILSQNIDCGYSLEPPRRGGSSEYPQSMFCLAK